MIQYLIKYILWIGKLKTKEIHKVNKILASSVKSDMKTNNKVENENLLHL